MIRRRGRSAGDEPSEESKLQDSSDNGASFGEIPLVEDYEEVDEVARRSQTKGASADAKEAGLQHWSAPAGTVPSGLEDESLDSPSGPSWQGDEDDGDAWGSDLSQVFAGNDGVRGSSRPSGRSRRIVKKPANPRVEKKFPSADETTPRTSSRVNRARPTQKKKSTSPVRPSTQRMKRPGNSGVQKAASETQQGDRPTPTVVRKARPLSDSSRIRKVQSAEAPRQSRNLRGRSATGSSPAEMQETAVQQTMVSSNLEEDSDLYSSEDAAVPQEVVKSSSDRDLPKAILVGIVLAIVSIAGIWFSPETAIILIGLVALLAVYELYSAMTSAGLRPAALLGLVGTVAVPAAAHYRGQDSYPLVIGLIIVFGSLWYLVGADSERPVLNLSLTVLGIFWIGGLAGFAGLMINADFELGRQLLLATILATAASDIMAYIGGRAYGVNKFHQASPNKTWEGTLTGVIAAFFVGLILGVLPLDTVFADNFNAALAFGATVGILSPIGDLAESMIKRDLGVKDMGTILPGHGGILDRIDGLLFALPGAYYTATLFSLLPA